MSVYVEKPARAAEFAKRLAIACDTNPLVPPIHYGRLTWLKAELAKRFNVEVSVETVRKWYRGDAKPRPIKLKMIAEILEADEVWLSMGIASDLTPRQQRLRDASVDGAVNLVAGLIQMDGGRPGFPLPDDERAEAEHVDLTAIIKGAQYAFHVVLASKIGEDYGFVIPINHEAVQIGVIPGENLCQTIVEIPETLIEVGVKRGGMINVTMTSAQIETHRIRTFSKRL